MKLPFPCRCLIADMPTTEDPSAIAKSVADFCLKNEFDGVDVNYEGESGSRVQWRPAHR